MKIIDYILYQNGQNIIAIRNLLTSCHYYQYIKGIVGITNDKKPSCGAGWLDHQDHFLIFMEISSVN